MCYLEDYNILEGGNTVLRGLIAEEYARYILIQRYPLTILRPKTVLHYLRKKMIKGQIVNFIKKYNQTMDYFGIGPIFEEDTQQLSTEEIVSTFFYAKEGLPQFMNKNEWVDKLEGFIIEVKSRTNMNSWAPFQYSLSTKQEKMINQSKKLGFNTILCGVTFGNNWNLSVVITNEYGKILPRDFLTTN